MTDVVSVDEGHGYGRTWVEFEAVAIERGHLSSFGVVDKLDFSNFEWQ